MSEVRLLAELSVDRAWKNIETMVNQFPSRLAGSDACWQAAGFVDEQLRAAGVKSELMEYQGLVSFPGKATLEVISPEYRSIPANVLGHSVSTGTKPVEGELVLEPPQGLGLRVDEVTEQVDLAPVKEGGQLDPGDEPHSHLPGRLRGRGQTGHGVVVGERPDHEARPGDLLGHLARSVLPVGGAAMGVEIDPPGSRAGLFHEGAPRAC